MGSYIETERERKADPDSKQSFFLKYYITLEIKVDCLASYHFKILKSIVMLLSNAETMVTKKESTYLLTSLTMK